MKSTERLARKTNLALSLMHEPHARLMGLLNGRKVYQFDVKIVLNKSNGTIDDWTDPTTIRESVIAYTAAAAADYARDMWIHRAETEITVYGPHGGRAAYRFIGWTSAIGSMMFNRPSARQLSLIRESASVNGRITEFSYAEVSL